jgi:hypothetical protein
MIHSNKIFRAHSGCWDYGSTDESKCSKNTIFKLFFSCSNEQKPGLMHNVYNLTRLRIYGRKIISRHFQLVRISYQKLDFHGVNCFSAVFIINHLNAWRYKSGTMNTKILFRLSFNRSEKKTQHYVGVYFVGSVRLLMMKTQKND